MKKIYLFTSLFCSLVSFSQTLTWEQCGYGMSSSGSPDYFNNSKTFTGVSLSSTDVRISIGLLGCNPVATNAGGIQLNGTTFIESNVPVQNCGINVIANNVYIISQSVFNQAVIDGGGTIVFSNYIKDLCVPGVGCSFVSDPCIKMTATYNVLSNETFEKSSFFVYPNPVKDILNLLFDKEITKVSIFNLVGQEVLSKEINASEGTIDVSNLPSGTYLAKVTSNEAVKTIKILKQ